MSRGARRGSGGRRVALGAAGALAAALAAGSVAVPVRAAVAAPDVLPASASYEQAAALFGACSAPAAVRTWAGAREILASVRLWREVADFASQDELRTGSPGSSIGLRSRVVGSGPAVGPVSERVALDPAMAWAVEWALRAGGSAYVALTAPEQHNSGWLWAPAQPAYVLVRHPDGRHFFAGDCAAEELTAPVRAALGSAYERVVGGLVGRAGPDVRTEFRHGTER